MIELLGIPVSVWAVLISGIFAGSIVKVRVVTVVVVMHAAASVVLRDEAEIHH